MKKILDMKKSIRKCVTQQRESSYPQHLMLKKRRIFEKQIINPQEPIQERRQIFEEQTNFGFSVTNQYVYVLLHLRTKTLNKNILNVNIPEVCVFVDKSPYDIISNQGGNIKGFKTNELMKCRFKDLHLTYKQAWKAKGYGKYEHISAVFKQKQVLLMSQTDFTISCKKIKSDPFFKRLEYIQNKLPYVGQQIIIEYDSNNKQDQLLKHATQSLLGYIPEEQYLKMLGSEERYLNFLNQKITLVLNYQQNIRVLKANFHYIKSDQNQYFLINVTNLRVSNLTKALKARQQRLKKIEDERCQILLLSPQKQKRYRSYENPQQVRKYELAMKQNFEKLVSKMNISSVSESKAEQVKNQLAFRKLHPRLKTNYKQVITHPDFQMTRQKLFGSTLQNRKPITVPSKYVLRSYNKINRCRTVFIEQPYL